MFAEISLIYLHIRRFLRHSTWRVQVLPSALVLAAITSYHKLGGLNTDAYFLQFWRLGNPKIKVLANLVPSEGLPSSGDRLLPLDGARKSSSLMSLLIRAVIHLSGLQSCDLIISQRSDFQIPLHWGLDLQHMNDTNIQSIAPTYYY